MRQHKIRKTDFEQATSIQRIFDALAGSNILGKVQRDYYVYGLDFVEIVNKLRDNRYAAKFNKKLTHVLTFKQHELLNL